MASQVYKINNNELNTNGNSKIKNAQSKKLNQTIKIGKISMKNKEEKLKKVSPINYNKQNSLKKNDLEENQGNDKKESNINDIVPELNKNVIQNSKIINNNPQICCNEINEKKALNKDDLHENENKNKINNMEIIHSFLSRMNNKKTPTKKEKIKRINNTKHYPSHNKSFERTINDSINQNKNSNNLGEKIKKINNTQENLQNTLNLSIKKPIKNLSKYYLNTFTKSFYQPVSMIQKYEDNYAFSDDDNASDEITNLNKFIKKYKHIQNLNQSKSQIKSNKKQFKLNENAKIINNLSLKNPINLNFLKKIQIKKQNSISINTSNVQILKKANKSINEYAKINSNSANPDQIKNIQESNSFESASKITNFSLKSNLINYNDTFSKDNLERFDFINDFCE